MQPVAVPLDAHPARLAAVDDRQHCGAHDGARGVRDVARKRAAVRGRLDELHVEFAVADKGAQVAAQPLEGADDGFERRALLIGLHPQPDEGTRRHIERHRARRAVVEPG